MSSDAAPRARMDIVLFCHPSFVSSQSMPRFAHMLKSSYEARGHRVWMLSPRARLVRFFAHGRMAKWAAYFDQYVLFPLTVRNTLRHIPPTALLVFCDQALGPWVPLAKGRPHVVHVHDLLALRSALGDVPENPTSFTGKVYQRYIRRGFRHGRHFISISHKTREDLHRFGGVRAITSEVVHNGLNHPFTALPFEDASRVIAAAGLPALGGSMLLNIGGGQWYKNLRGVIAIYAQYVELVERPPLLLCVGPEPKRKVREAIASLPDRARVVFVRNVDTPTLQALYSRADALLFPSLAEGFGWPLVEAQACGCPVLTTAEPPMNEVAGDAACYIPRLRADADLDAWARHAAARLYELMSECPADKSRRRERGRQWARRFDADVAIDRYLAVYDRVRSLPPAHCDLQPNMHRGAEI